MEARPPKTKNIESMAESLAGFLGSSRIPGSAGILGEWATSEIYPLTRNTASRVRNSAVTTAVTTTVKLPAPDASLAFRAGRDIPWRRWRTSGNKYRFLRDGPDKASQQRRGQYSRSEDAGEYDNLKPSGFQG